VDPQQELDSREYLFLRAIEEPSDNVLKLVLQEGSVTGPAQDVQIGSVRLSGTREVKSDEQSAVYEVIFPGYVAYSVLNESYTTADPAEQYAGRRFRVYSRSKFMEYVRVATFIADDFPGPVTHYEVLCENHVIDIAATGVPQVRRGRQAG
jgi:hypothetical protein